MSLVDLKNVIKNIINECQNYIFWIENFKSCSIFSITFSLYSVLNCSSMFLQLD